MQQSNSGEKSIEQDVEEKISAKKLVQARLPFKRVEPGSSANVNKITTTEAELTKDNMEEIRKRKLSFESEDGDNHSTEQNCQSKENLRESVQSKKKKLSLHVVEKAKEIVVLGDSSEDGSLFLNNLGTNQVKSNPVEATPSSKTETVHTPKLQFKLQFFNEKKKNRKRKSQDNTTISPTFQLENDEDAVDGEIHLQKKSKLVVDAINLCDGKEDEVVVEKTIDADVKTNQVVMRKDENLLSIKESAQKCDYDRVEKCYEITKNETVEDVVEDSEKLSSTTCASADEGNRNDSSATVNNSLLNSCNALDKRIDLTSKQKKLLEQRRKVREEKERKLQEQRRQKQLMKEQKELAKKREREEREQLKRKEREQKELKRLEEVDARIKEKLKRNVAKEQEMRRKEKERKRKEQEREEAELKKKKAAEAFTKFFVPKTQHSVQPAKNNNDGNTANNSSNLAFQPFQVRNDMKLAPMQRKHLTCEAHDYLDEALYGKIGDDTAIKESKDLSYLVELKTGKILPGKWGRTYEEPKDDVIILEDELDRVGQAIVEETPSSARECMKVKFYKFHDNRRPPYYGTWRKKSSIITPRTPLAQDKKFFDYDVDSDDEWEEEEPGESLDGSEDDKDKDSEDDDYEVDNEWFVPHGHLSEEELQNEDEVGGAETDNTREAQKIKLQLLQQEFAQEMKKKTEKIKPRLIGCIWVDENGNQPEDCAKIIWDNLQQRAVLCSEPPIIEETELESHPPSGCGATEKIGEKLKPLILTDELIKKLACLMHGNKHSKNFLIKEYIAYVENTEDAIKSGEVRGPLKSVVREKMDEIAEWKVIDSVDGLLPAETHLDVDENDKKKKKQKNKKKLCWVVGQDTLQRMGLQSLDLKNSWHYSLTPTNSKAKKTLPQETIDASAIETIAEQAENVLDVNTNTKNTKTKSPEEENVKKRRVSLPVTVPRDQKIKTSPKTKLISEFLNKSTVTKITTTSHSSKKLALEGNAADDEVIILD